MSTQSLTQEALDKGAGVFRLTPAWVPRSFCRPGCRIKLHPDDTYAFGAPRGGIDERWLSSATHAENGPATTHDEGLSYIVVNDTGGPRVLLRDALHLLGAAGIGEALQSRYGRLPMYSKFFDNMGPLPHHIHHDDAHAALVGQSGKPEMYFFPAQMNNHPGEFPYTFFGLNPETTKEQVLKALRDFDKGDNRITDLARAFRLTPDTGFNVPPGVLHAPGSLCTYEPQFASDVFAMYQSVLPGGQVVGSDLLWKDSPAGAREANDIQALFEVIDWPLNVAHNLHEAFYMAPKCAGNAAEQLGEGFLLEWICYKNPLIGAQRLTLKPRRSYTLRMDAPFGVILLQGRGRFGAHAAETPTLIRFGQDTRDEFFATAPAAANGVLIVNDSDAEDLVLLAHFACHPALPLA